MKSKMLMLAGFAGMLMTSPSLDALAEVRVNIGGGPRAAYVIDRPPAFIRLAIPGFSVSVGAPYDIILSVNFYYLYDHGQWYRSPRYDGPWRAVRYRELPSRIRRYRIDQIRRFRDDEYHRRYDRRYDWRDERRDNWRDERRDNWRDERRDNWRDERRDDGRPDRWDGPGRR